MVSITTGGAQGETMTGEGSANLPEPDVQPKTEGDASATRPVLRWGLLALVVAAFALAIWMGLPERLSLPALRVERHALLAFVHAHPWQSVAAYVAIYTAVVALSIPGALVMTLMGGLLFGAVEGGAAAVCGVSMGSILMFLAARTAVGENLRVWLTRRYAIMRRLEGEVRGHPFTITLMLRLVPIAPICLVNLAAGFVRMPVLPYAAATVLGVIPSTFLYTWVGSGLDRLFDTVAPGALMGVIRGQLLLPASGLVLLAVVPLAVRWWTGRRVAPKPGVG